MAEGVARSHPQVTLTVTDVDPAMVFAASRRLSRYASVRVEPADVTALPYPSGSFDFVSSYLMLHHVINWVDALSEAARVLRPGGILVGYDLTDTKAARLVHRLDGSPYRMIKSVELADALDRAGFIRTNVRVSMGRHLMRFSAATGDV